MDDFLNHIGEILLAMEQGPLHFRLWIQPTMALVLAVRDGRRDARAGASLFTLSLFTKPARRWALLRAAWRSIAKVFILAMVLDTVFQILALGRVFPGEAALVACVLTVLPYLLIRGPANRLFRHKFAHGH